MLILSLIFLQRADLNGYILNILIQINTGAMIR